MSDRLACWPQPALAAGKSRAEIGRCAGRAYPRPETCKQSFRGVVVVQHICAQVMLTGVVGGRSQTAHRSHLSSHTTVGLEAQQSNQRGHRRGGGRLQRHQQVCQGLATGGGSPSRHSCDLTASEPAARPRPQLLFFWLRRNKKQCRGADFGGLGGT